MPFAYSIVPIAPSQTSTRCSMASRNGTRSKFLILQPSAGISMSSGRSAGMNSTTRSRQTERTPATVGLGEPVVVPEQVQPRPHCRQHLVDLGLAGVVAARRPKGTRRLMGQEDVDVRDRFARAPLPRERSGGAGRPVRWPSACSSWDAAGPPPPARTSSGRTCRRGRRRGGRRSSISSPLRDVGVGVWRGFSVRRSFMPRHPPAVEILVVALDPVERRRERLVAAVGVRDITHTKPERHLAVPFHDSSCRLEGAVNVAERAEHQLSSSRGAPPAR